MQKEMSRVALVGDSVTKIRSVIRKAAPSLKFVKESPDAVISFGGDGTILLSERLFPGVPKLNVRDRGDCMSCEAGRALRSKARGSGKYIGIFLHGNGDLRVFNDCCASHCVVLLRCELRHVR